MSTPDTREAWLSRAIDIMRPWFTAAGESVPAVRVSIGFPGGGSPRKRIGECWSGKASADGMVSIFISPTLGELSSEVSILAVLVHELVHAAGHMGHGASFKRCATAVGLTGPMRATIASPALIERLNTLCTDLGPWPGSRLDLAQRPTKKQSTRMLKLVCEDCGFICRASSGAVEAAGYPTCGCGGTIHI